VKKYNKKKVDTTSSTVTTITQLLVRLLNSRILHALRGLIILVHTHAKRHPPAAIIVVVITTTFQSSCFRFLEKIAKVVSINCIQDFTETIAAHRIVF